MVQTVDGLAPNLHFATLMTKHSKIIFRFPKMIELGLLVVLMSSTGCITASLATLGTVVGFLGTAASTGADAYKLGKLDAALMTTLPDAQSAVRHAACDLGLQLLSTPPESPDLWTVRLFDDKKAEITITIHPRASRMCLCRVNVGIFGSEPSAKLIMERIRSNLPSAPAKSPKPS